MPSKNMIMKKICPKCGAEFECKHAADCWCSRITLTDTTKLFLKERYNDCLCEKCLLEIANNNP